MMMPKKKKKILIILSIVIFLLIILTTLILLYIYTDNFKSNSTLFAKYMGQNIENIDSLYSEIGKSEYDQMLQENKYTTQTQVNVNFVENRGKTSENTQNSINQLKLEINGQTDKKNEFEYQNIDLLNSNEEVAEVEYIQSKNTYGIKFSDLFNQYLMINNEHLKDFFRKIGYTDEQLENIPNSINMNIDLKSIFQFSEEEWQNLREKYIEIISSSFSEENFSKQKNQIIKINGNDVIVNGYVLTLTKEQLNNMYIKVLEKVREDEIILSKIDNFESIIKEYQPTKTSDLRKQFIEKIDEKITNIIKNNIGTDETKIIVYESSKTTVKTIIETSEYEISMELLSNNKDRYMKISYKDVTSSKDQVQTIEIYKNANQIDANYEQIDGENIKKYGLNINEKIDNNKCEKDILIKYEDNSNKIDLIAKQNIEMVDNFENDIILDEKSAINLSNLEEEKLRALLGTVSNSVSNKIEELKQNVISEQDLWNVIITAGIVKEKQVLEAMGITETEKNRFNSKFEILEGENLESSKILTVIEAIKDNLVGYEVISSEKLRLKLDRFDKKEEIAIKMNKLIEENTNKKYNIEVEYDEKTGLVDGILITILEK